MTSRPHPDAPAPEIFTRRRFLTAVSVAVGLTAVGGCGGGEVPTVRMAAGEPGGFYDAFARLLAATAERAGTLRIEPVTTAGSLANLELLVRGEVDTALALADSVVEAAPGPLAVGRVYENYLQLVVRADSPVRRVADLRGARINVGNTGSGATASGEKLLRAAGVDPVTEVTATHLPLSDAATALVTGRLDALLWAGGVPTSALDIPATMRLVDLADVTAAMRDRFGYLYDPVLVPADAYPNTPAVRTIGIANLLVAAPALSETAAAALTDLLVGYADALVPAEAAGTQFLDVRSLIDTAGIALHPGAARVYRDRHG
ncbi:TAXI family TRAP transporter solute-binding subunit [Nocardia otitidiscaviarum]|uniref:TAXI family TRAP transporter solute-binding subunit n=1 Tax=Nocardia otitidiscaviarum TaxID=1823 RepID=UPI002458480E|nr:TAXI family TRAP transporter solute-binding subunit [Nocardia otitidiscaviarum]